MAILRELEIPFQLLSCPPKKPPQISPTKKHRPFEGNKVDLIRTGDILGYFKEQPPKPPNGNNVHLVLLDNQEVKKLILSPLQFPGDISNLVTLKPAGKLNPGFVPDFADFALLPKPLKIVMRWILEREDEIPHVLKSMWLTTAPTLPRCGILFELCCGSIHLKSYSDTNNVQVLRLKDASDKKVHITVSWESVSSSVLDGRKFMCMLDVNLNTKPAKSSTYNGQIFNSLEGELRILVWNCKGMGRPSFMGNFKHLVEGHMADIVVLTETRISTHLLHSVLKDTHIWRAVGVSPEPVFGGVVIISTQPNAQFLKDNSTPRSINGSIYGRRTTFE